MTPEVALAVGRAVARDGAEVVLGRDGRTTGPGLAAALTAGLVSGGADVRRAGVVPTPALAAASRGRLGVTITASHNPPPDNGIKVFADGVEYDRGAERRVEERVAAGDEPAPWDRWGDVERVDVLGAYRDEVAAFVGARGGADRREAVDGARSDGHDGCGPARGSSDGTGEPGADPLDGLRVAVDCGNGASALATPQVLRALDADVTALNANVDGHFPGRASKPTAASLADVRAFVRRRPFDLGIAHDGDADRVVVLDGDGEVVHEDTVVAIIAEHYARESAAGDPVVVTTPNASARVDERVRAAGGRVERVRLGALHEGIASAREAGGDVVFAAEPWKHVHPALGGWIDGVASAALVAALVADAGGLGPLREPVAERPYRKVGVDCPEDLKAPAMDLVAERLPREFPDADVDTEYGVRLELSDASWVLVRPSGTEPFVRVYAESDDVEALVETAVGVVEGAVADAGEG